MPVQPTAENFGSSVDGGKVITWASVPNADVGITPGAGLCGNVDKSVAVTGTFGGATVAIQGSNDGSNWFTLSDPAGDAVTFTAAGIAAVMEATLHIRPSISGGDGTTSITVTMFAKLAR